MKNAIILFLLAAVLPAGALAQRSSVFLNSRPLSGPGEVDLHLPLGLFSGAAAPLYDTTLETRIITAMNAVYKRDRADAKHGIGVSISVPGRPQWSGAIGFDDETTPMDTNLAFEIASNTKTFVTALIMKLQDNGMISIKDTIGKWLPKKYPNVSGAITIEQLLNHSSGIYDYLNDDPTDAALYAFYDDPSTPWTPDSILMTFVGPPNFKPGTSYRYSNTNFLLAGMIAERAGGDKLNVLLHKNFIDPLHLTRTFFGGVDSVTIPFAHNWTPLDTLNPEIDYHGLDKTGQLTGAWGAGNMISATGDLIQWVNQLYTGKVVSKNALKQMMTMHKWPDGSSYGLGTQSAPYYTKTFYGHTGSLIGFKSAMFTNTADSVSLVVYMNSDAIYKDVSVNDYTIAVLNEIYRVVKSAVPESSAPSVSVEVYPNPATDEIHFAFRIDRESTVRLALYNEIGEEIRTLLNEPMTSGVHSATMDATRLHSGTYFYRLQTGEGMTAGKVFVK
ncbi:MAG: serine hydrolase [Bacteroidota bacterium]|nr:serine hydrolase [Bacteroidota bacterium]MDP4231596.1 serine hydrolase [Bacteroidota bacterium]MDP4235156.1 serine hydrolase [Bacteroidota bacterium]